MAFVAGNDETFAVLMFVLVACLNLVIWIPSTLRFLYYLIRYEQFRQHNKRWAQEWFETFRFIFTRPAAVKLGLKTLNSNRGYAKQFMWPRAKTYFSWRLVFFALFLFLLSVVAYQKLTFDPYAELGLESGADTNKVKKAYRHLSMKYHPDKDPSEEARVIYRSVRRAYKALTDPESYDKEMKEEAASGSGAVGVALPTIITDPEYARYSMTILIGITAMLPIWMIYKLLVRNRRRDTIWVQLKQMSQYHQMTQPFYLMLGQTDCFETRYQRQERPLLAKLVARIEKAVPGKDLFKDPEGVLPRGELSTQELFECFCPPDVGTRVELRQLFMDAAPVADAANAPAFGRTEERQSSPTAGNKQLQRRGSAKGGDKGRSRQQDAHSILVDRLLIDPDAIPHAAYYLRHVEPPPTESEVRDSEQYRRFVRAHSDELKLEDPELVDRPYRAPTADEISVGQYFLLNILWVMRWHVNYTVPREQGRRPMFDKLLSIHKEKVDELEAVRRQAEDEKKEAERPVMSSSMKKILVRVFNKDTLFDKYLFEVIDEVKQMSRRWHKHQLAEHQRMEREWRANQAKLQKRAAR
eukprot:TRINITY_DN59914_c0_g1_i1.p1 TRINITY_DN59914_c0_g1~~TRINITY_DN59914_c0_g1_i1.p1  ORF type:complete len:619 (+),score=200.67 TRINITY_DN59914_c0_g1_i1:112-1857(+)